MNDVTIAAKWNLKSEIWKVINIALQINVKDRISISNCWRVLSTVNVFLSKNFKCVYDKTFTEAYLYVSMFLLCRWHLHNNLSSRKKPISSVCMIRTLSQGHALAQTVTFFAFDLIYLTVEIFARPVTHLNSSLSPTHKFISKKQVVVEEAENVNYAKNS